MNQIFSKGQKYQKTDSDHQQANQQLKAEGIAHSLMIALSVILRPKNPGSGNRSENTEVKHHHKLIGYRNSRHLVRSGLSYHNIVEQADEIGNPGLDNNWNHYDKQQPVKLSIPNKCLFKIFHSYNPFLPFWIPVVC